MKPVSDDILTLPEGMLLLRELPRDVPALCSVVQNLLIHDAAITNALYGSPPDTARIDRATQPVAHRLSAALAGHSGSLMSARQPYTRQVGTCRDFAVMLCAFARFAGYDARVRCGFAAYFGTGAWEDHWIVQYRDHTEPDWSLADPQLDAAHKTRYQITFDPAKIPTSMFMTADLAWRAWREGAVCVNHLQHGNYAGQRLSCVNLVRDALAQADDVLISDWDNWRSLKDLGGPLPETCLTVGDRLSQGDHTALKDLLSEGLAGLQRGV